MPVYKKTTDLSQVTGNFLTRQELGGSSLTDCRHTRLHLKSDNKPFTSLSGHNICSSLEEAFS